MSGDLKIQVNEIVRRVEKAGCRVQRNGSGHLKVYREGRLIGTLPSTPSDPRGIQNSVAMLRRAGVDVRRPNRKRKGVTSDRQSAALRERVVAATEAGFSMTDLARHSMEVARSRGIRGFKTEHSGEVVLSGLRGGRRVSKWTHDLVAATLNDLEGVGRTGAPKPIEEPEPVARGEQLELPEVQPDMSALGVEWDGVLESLERTVRLARAALRRTFEEIG